MIAFIGRSLFTRVVGAITGAVGLPSPQLFIVVTALAACAALYSRRVVMALALIAVTGMISFGVSAIHAAERHHGLRPASVAWVPARTMDRNASGPPSSAGAQAASRASPGSPPRS